MKGVMLPSLDGKTRYHLRFTVNSIIQFEEETGRSVLETFGDLEAVKENPGTSSVMVVFKALRTVVCGALMHAEPGVTLERAGDVIEDCGMQQSMEAVMAALVSSFPEMQQDGGKAPSGSRAKRGAGSRGKAPGNVPGASA